MRQMVLPLVGLVTFAAFFYGLGRIDGNRVALEPVVTVDGDAIIMKQGPIGVQTVSKLDGGSTGLYYDWSALVGVFNPDATSVLMLGLGGGEMLRVLKRTVPRAALTAVEVDDRVVSAALRNFPENVKDVTIVTADAARYMGRRCPGPRWDAIVVDIFDGSDIPLHFTSVGFFKDVERCLLPRGMVIMNARDRQLAKTIASALHEAGFVDVVAFPVLGTDNVILWAVRKDDWGDVVFPPELQAGVVRRWQL